MIALSRKQVLICLALTLTLFAACHRTLPAPVKPATEQSKSFQPRALRDVVYERTPARFERGKYLTEGLLQCFICHSDRDWNKPGAPPLANKKGAGHIWEDRPWLVAPNLTPDKETGAGDWTDDMFARAPLAESAPNLDCGGSTPLSSVALTLKGNFSGSTFLCNLVSADSHTACCLKFPRPSLVTAMPPDVRRRLCPADSHPT